MAIVRSHSVAGARKSAGMITYRQVRGRTIASQKRAQSGKIPSQQQTIRHMAMKVAGIAAKIYSSSIKNSFDKTKYGNESNLFVKDNYSFFKAMISFEPGSGSSIAAKLGPWATLYDAMLNNMQQTSFLGWDDVLDTYMSESDLTYIRIDKGDIYDTENGISWMETADPVPTPVISGFNVVVTSAGGAGLFNSLTITSGSNLAAGMVVKVAGVVLPGSWTNDNTKFVPTNTATYYQAKEVSIYFGSTLLHSRTVSFSNESEGE